MSIRQCVWIEEENGREPGTSLDYGGGERWRGWGGHQWEKALSSLSDVFKDNEPHPLHSVLTLTHCARTHTHQVKHLKARTQCRHTWICPSHVSYLTTVLLCGWMSMRTLLITQKVFAPLLLSHLLMFVCAHTCEQRVKRHHTANVHVRVSLPVSVTPLPTSLLGDHIKRGNVLKQTGCRQKATPNPAWGWFDRQEKNFTIVIL